MSENHFFASPAQANDVESMMAEARAIDALLSGGSTKPADGEGRDRPDPSILLVLCRALENEASAGLQSLKREHLIKIHGSLALLKEDVERRLVGCLEPILA